MPKKRIVFQPDSHRGIQQGIHQIVEPIQATLGPMARTVAVADYLSHKSPEILDNGATIARRIVQLADPDADMGAMMVRHLLWRLYESVGDGTATAAVVFRTVYDEGIRYLAAGGNAMRLRHFLDIGASVLRRKLSQMACPIEGAERLTRLAESVCYDKPLAKYIGEIMSIIGKHGYLDIRAGNSRELVREYIEGAYWNWGVFSRDMLTNAVATTIDKPAILLTDLEIVDPREIVPALEAAIRAGYRSMLIIARNMSDKTIGLLTGNNNRGKFYTLAVKIPGQFSDPTEILEDIAVLTGANIFLRAKGDTLITVNADDLGTSEEVWADRTHVGIVTDSAAPEKIELYMNQLVERFGQSDESDVRQRLQERIGKLRGGSALLWVGGSTETELTTRKTSAERTVKVIRSALRGGVLPGGGVSLLCCRTAIQAELAGNDDTDARAASMILCKALETPMRTIIQNAGYEAGSILANLSTSKRFDGFDVMSGQEVDMLSDGIYDVADAYIASVSSAITSAALALTVDVLIHQKSPEHIINPA